ncbi:MAG TPA: ATP-binding protein [Candidatus Limnocylindrales bacterium]|nr:ATP-binding protein [Candidatus Limnocylindrales bacterium]
MPWPEDDEKPTGPPLEVVGGDDKGRRTGFRSRAAIVQLVVAAAAAVIVAICGISSIQRIGAPYPGFFVWENLFVPAVGLPSWPGAASGLEYHSWLLAADGRPLRTSADLDAILATKRVGETVAYEAERGGERYVVRVPVSAFGFESWAVSTGVYFFDSVVLLLLAVAMLYLKPGDPAPMAVFYFAVAQALYLATSIDLFGPYRFRVAYFFFAGLTPTATLYMLSRFPVERKRGRGVDLALLVALAGSVTYGALSNLAFFRNPSLLLALDRIVHVAMAGSALAAFAFFAWHFFTARSEAVRQRTLVVMLGSIGAFLPTMVFLIAFYSGALSLPFNFLAIPFVLFPLGIGYAVARHDLFDVDTVIKRTIVYATLSVLVFGSYSLIIGLFDYFFENATPVASRIAEGILIVALVLVTNPSRQRLQEVVNRLYDRRRYEYRDVVRATARAFTRILELDRLVPAVLELIDTTLQPEFARIYTMTGPVPRLRGELVHPPGQSAAMRTPQGEGVEEKLEPMAALVCRAEGVLDARRPSSKDAREQAAATAMTAIGADLAAGMTLEGRAVGFLLVGPKRSGGAHRRDEVDLLRTIADQLAVALHNAEAFRTIDAMARDLEGKNVELGRALEELRSAQDELVVKERLAAVGELASAVAHTIRNPLAGMRASAQQAAIELADHPSTDLVEAFVRETDRLSARIDALLNFARPFHPEPRPVVLAELAREAVAQTRGKAEAKGLVVHVDAAEDAGAVRVDPALFEQLTIELVANAIDASPRGGAVVVGVGVDGSGQRWVEVRDGGPGIPQEKASELFRMFFTTKAKGTGIGLATVKKIADAHGATITVGSAREGGACFRVTLPPASQALALERR